MLIAAIEEQDISPEEAYKMCVRLEDQVAQFFIDKYSHLGDGPGKTKSDWSVLGWYVPTEGWAEVRRFFWIQS